VPAAQSASCNYTARLKTNASTWLVGLDYKIFPDVLLYGKVSRGYKSGGVNLQAVFINTRTFEPETVTSYEGGVKSDFRLGDVPVRLNLSGYVLDYNDIQRAGGDFNPTTGAGGAVIRNADARIKGIEAELSIRPARWLEIGGNFSHTDADYKRYEYVTPTGQAACNGVVAPGGTADLSCLPFQYVARYIYSVHADLNVPLANDLGRLNFFVNYSHTSSQYTDPGTLPVLQPGARLEPFGLLNATLDWSNVGNSGFDVGLFVTNATNKLYRISNTNVYQPGALLYQSTLYGEPRMYGLKLRYRFGGE
jgi:iron complex outermembrane receptor protein